MRKLREYHARNSGVSPEHLLAVYRARLAWRRARADRWRRRQENTDKDVTKANRFKAQQCPPDVVQAGEGPLNALMRSLGIGVREFCRLADYPIQQFSEWYGHPLYGWPIRFLQWVGYATAMEAKLKELGYDCKQFEPVIPMKPRYDGRYMRKTVTKDERARLVKMAEEWSAWPRPKSS